MKRKTIAGHACAKGSVHTMRVGRKHKTSLSMCCPKGKWDAKAKRCRVKMKAIVGAKTRSKRRLGDFNDAMYVGKIYAAHIKRDGVSRVPSVVRDSANKLITKLFGGATRYKATGNYLYADGTMSANEPTTTWELLGPADASSCSLFADRVKDAAKRVARMYDQESVLTVVNCGGTPDVDFVKP